MNALVLAMGLFLFGTNGVKDIPFNQLNDHVDLKECQFKSAKVVDGATRIIPHLAKESGGFSTIILMANPTGDDGLLVDVLHGFGTRDVLEFLDNCPDFV